jgi:hypothetical protein
MYYLVEIQNLDTTEINKLLIKDEDVSNLITNLDKNKFGLLNMYGMGFLDLEYSGFIKKQSS